MAGYTFETQRFYWQDEKNRKSFLVTVDVVSQYPSIPHKEGVLALKITHMWKKWDTPQNFLLAFIDELWKTGKIRILRKNE